MKMTRYAQMFVFLGLMLCLVLPPAFGQAGKAAKKEFTFKGKVEKIDANAKTLTVNGQNVVGWMSAMTMNYGVDKDDVLKRVKVGDQITAKVYEGDFKVLHDVQIVPPAANAAPKK